MRVETPVRCAVVGTKNIAGKHIPVLQALPESTIVALCDIDAQAVSTAAHQFGVDKTFTSVESLQAWGEYDAVYVLVSVLAVADIAELFLRAGTPTFIEKPPGLYTVDTERLAAVANETGTIATVGLNRRFYSNTMAGRDALLETGEVVSVTVHADEDVGPKWDDPRFPPEVAARWVYANSIHALDLIRYFGGDIAKVSSVQRKIGLPVPDSFSAIIDFESGAIGRALADHFAQRGGHRYQVRTATATLTSGHTLEDSCTLTRRNREPVQFSLTGLDRRLKPGFPGESKAFLHAVQTGNPVEFPSPTLVDAVKTMQMLDAITGANEWSPKSNPVSQQPS